MKIIQLFIFYIFLLNIKTEDYKIENNVFSKNSNLNLGWCAYNSSYAINTITANNISIGESGYYLNLDVNEFKADSVFISIKNLNIENPINIKTLNVKGETTLSGVLNANGGINCDSDKFTIANNTGNVATAGTLNIAGATTLGKTLDVTGATTLSSTLAVGAINKSQITTIGGGNNIITLDSGTANINMTAGTFALTGNKTVSGTLGITGATTLTGVLNANGGINCDTDKFTIANNTGNVATAGTLNVTGKTILSNTLSAGASTLASLSVTGNQIIGGTLNVTGQTILTTLKLNNLISVTKNENNYKNIVIDNDGNLFIANFSKFKLQNILKKNHLKIIFDSYILKIINFNVDHNKIIFKFIKYFKEFKSIKNEINLLKEDIKKLKNI